MRDSITVGQDEFIMRRTDSNGNGLEYGTSSMYASLIKSVLS